MNCTTPARTSNMSQTKLSVAHSVHNICCLLRRYCGSVQQHLPYVVRLIEDRHTWRKTTDVIIGLNGSHWLWAYRRKRIAKFIYFYQSTCTSCSSAPWVVQLSKLLWMTQKPAAHTAACYSYESYNTPQPHNRPIQ